MKAVKVEYIVQDHYIATNKENIRKVMDAIKANPVEGMFYSSYTDKDNPAKFIHINMAANAEVMSKLNNIPEFTDFRMALKASQPVQSPKQTTLELVGAGFEM